MISQMHKFLAQYLHHRPRRADRDPERSRRMMPAAPLQDRRGAVLVEFAFTAPILLVLLCGTLSYGGWIGLAHAVQQSANEGARAAIGGLDPDERATLARDRAMATMRSYRVDPARVLVSVSDNGDTLTVTVDYDASHDPRLALKIVPVPTTLIQRRSVVSVAGL
jgi:Flp pilus assembly protein TadG